ncbi:MAG: hypothetical protein RQ885_05775 [Desulfurococcales archaeon]|jgi:hypothetical protein|nr:hypothetical protein [Desulfurococcales archaeon]
MTYRYLLRRIERVAEEHWIRVVLVNRKGSSSRCPVYRAEECGRKIVRNLFKGLELNKYSTQTWRPCFWCKSGSRLVR